MGRICRSHSESPGQMPPVSWRRGEPTAQAGLGLEQFPASSKPASIGSAPRCLAEFVKAISLAWRFSVLSSSCPNLLNPWRQRQLWSGCAQESPRHSAPVGQDFRRMGSGSLGPGGSESTSGKKEPGVRNQPESPSRPGPSAQEPSRHIIYLPLQA